MSAERHDMAGAAVGSHDFVVISNEQVARDTYRLELSSHVSWGLMPGQFMNFEVPGDGSHILRIPLSFASCDLRSSHVVIYYVTVGEGTRRLCAMRPGDTSTVVGPCGKGWHLPEKEAGRCLLVSGGIVTWWRNPNIDMQKLTTTSTLATGGSSDSGSSSAGSVTETSGEAGLKSGNYDGWNYYMYTPEKSNGSLVVFLHGSGEIGTNVEKLKNDGGFAAHIANGSNYNSYVLMPQLPSGNWLEGDNPTQKLRALIDKTVAENNIDRSRIHIVGFSMGANQLPDVVENNPGLFASATIITNAWYGRTNELKRMPVRIYYGRDDTANNGGAQPLYNELHNAGSQVEIYSYSNQWHANTVGRVLDDQETNFMDWIMRQQRD